MLEIFYSFQQMKYRFQFSKCCPTNILKINTLIVDILSFKDVSKTVYKTKVFKQIFNKIRVWNQRTKENGRTKQRDRVVDLR